MDTIWKVKKIEGGFTIQKADIKKLGNQLDISVPQEILDKYPNLTMGQRIGIPRECKGRNNTFTC